MLGKQTEPLRKIYLSIAKGKVERTLENGQKESYNYVEGRLEQIHSKERTFGSDTVKYWYLDLRDGEELYSIGCPVYSGVLRSIILSLASEQSLSPNTLIRLETYEKNGYTKVSVFADGVGLDWITKELPAVKTQKVGGRTVKDESERDAYIESLIDSIQKRIQRQ